MILDRRLVGHFDWGLLGSFLAIPLVGLVVLYSAGYDPEASWVLADWLPLELRSSTFVRQFLFFGIGLVAMLVALSVPTQTLHRYSYLIYGLCIVLLVGVLLFGVVSHGSRRWFSLGSVNFQPSELVKLGLVLGLARYLSKHPPKQNCYSLLELFVPGIFVALPVALIIRQPDLGTALAVAFVGVAMVLFMGVRFKSLLILAVITSMALVPAWYSLHDYQKRRIKVLLNPEQDPTGSGWHITQSKIAVGSGELFGKGYLKGTQTQLEFLPERTTDFVFCVLAEETGFLGCVFVLMLYALLLYRILRVSIRSKDVYGALVCVGIAALIFFHMFVNVGMVIGLLPIVGLPLPLLSYGGSALLSNLFAGGVALGISMRRLLFVK